MDHRLYIEYELTTTVTVENAIPRQRSQSLAAWIVTVVAAVAALCLAVVLIVQLARPTKYEIGASDQQAMDAASQIVVNVSTLSRKSYDSDFTRAVSGLTGRALASIQQERGDYIAALNDGKFDTQGKVTAVALESSSKDAVMVLIYLDGYRVTDDGKSQKGNTNALDVTVKNVNKKWLVENIDYLGLETD